MRVRRRDEEIANEKEAHLQCSSDGMLMVKLLITDDSSWGDKRDDIESCDTKRWLISCFFCLPSRADTWAAAAAVWHHIKETSLWVNRFRAALIVHNHQVSTYSRLKLLCTVTFQSLRASCERCGFIAVSAQHLALGFRSVKVRNDFKLLSVQ